MILFENIHKMMDRLVSSTGSKKVAITVFALVSVLVLFAASQGRLVTSNTLDVVQEPVEVVAAGSPTVALSPPVEKQEPSHPTTPVPSPNLTVTAEPYRKSYQRFFDIRCNSHRLRERRQDEARPKVIMLNPYNGEADLLEVKLDEVYPMVDIFVILESRFTFRGGTRAVLFDKDDPRFAKYSAKIVHHLYNLPTEEEARSRGWHPQWAAETQARAAGYDAVKDVIQLGDLVISSDVDEVPRREALQLLHDCAIEPHQFPVVLEMPLTYFSFEFESNPTWLAVRVLPFTNRDRHMFQRSQARGPIHIGRAGWHCSFCFESIDQFINKLETYSHQEHDKPEFKNRDRIKKALCDGVDIMHNNQHLRRYSQQELLKGGSTIDDADLPMHVLRNKERFAYLLPGGCALRK